MMRSSLLSLLLIFFLSAFVGCTNPLGEGDSKIGEEYNPGAPEGASPAAPIAAFTITSITPATLSAVAVWSSATGATSYDLLYDTVSRIGGGNYASSLTAVSSGATVTSLAAGTTYYFRVRANGVSGSVLSTNEISTQVYQTFTLNIPFTQGTDASYVISSASRVDLTGGIAWLTSADQTDSVTNTFVSSGGFQDATTLTGVQWDNTNSYVRLNTTTNTAELDSSWTPQWSSLVGYWKLDGSGLITNGASISATVGENGTATNTNGTGMSFGTGQLNSSITFDGIDENVRFTQPPAANTNLSTGSVFAWIKTTNAGASYRGIVIKQNAYGIFLRDNVLSVYDWGTNLERSTGISLNDGNWHHVGFTFQSGVTNGTVIYIDGISRLTTTMTIFSQSAGLAIGSGNNSGANQNFAGSIDEASIWNSVLTPTQIQTIYARQSAKFSGQLTSRVLDAFSSQSWTTLAATSTLPFYKELPGSVGSESSGVYSAVAGGLMSGLVGYWKLNEASGTTGANSVVDSSGQSNHGIPVGGVTFGNTGVLNNSTLLNGTTGYINTGTMANFGSNLATGFSFSTWFRTTSTASQALFGTINTGFTTGALLTLNSAPGGGANVTGTIRLMVRDNNNRYLDTGYNSDANFDDGNWHHIVVSTVPNTNLTSMYLDGKSLTMTVTNISALAFSDFSFPMALGAINVRGTINNFFQGSLDETAMWNRALTAAEVLELYRRGANRLKYQLRSCSAADCSDQEALTSTYKGWKGPDNTGLTYFSELYNTTNNVLAGTVSTGTPTMTFSNFSGTGLSVSTNRYFQYRAIFESDDQNNLCNYGSGAANCSPELKSIAIGPNHYDTTVHSITTTVTIGAAFETLDTNGLTETLGVNSCTAGARYSVSRNGSNFFYWNGSAWDTSTDDTTANDAATLRSNISSFPTGVGTGTLYVRTYLRSSGTSPCEIDNLQFTGRRY